MRHRLDANQKTITDAASRMGWYFWNASQSGLGVDGFLVKGGRLVPVEIKDGSKPPSAQRLTPREAETQATLALHGVHVELLTCVEDLLVLERVETRHSYDDRQCR